MGINNSCVWVWSPYEYDRRWYGNDYFNYGYQDESHNDDAVYNDICENDDDNADDLG